MTLLARMLEPALELELYDPEHVTLRARRGEASVELVLEDEALRRLERERVMRRVQVRELEP